MKQCKIIGISDSRKQWFIPKVAEIISNGTVFSGGKRHYEIMSSFLPEGALWIDITVPLSDVFEQYKKHDDIVIFASGDPLFYGFANTVKRECPDAIMEVYPSFNSLQMLAHKLNIAYQDMRMVSLTGRSWDKFDEALISGETLIGCLTDRNKTPENIIDRMLEYGYNNYEVYVGENLGNEESETISHVSAGTRCKTSHSIPNCMILRRVYQRCQNFGIPESEFSLLDGRVKMITKMPVRLLSLSMLGLHNRKSFWDIGFCTGSVSIEAKLQFPHLQVTAFEVRAKGEMLIEQNSRKFGTPGITSVIGDFLMEDLSLYSRPDAVFIGGHGGKLKEIISRIKGVMTDDAVIVFNSVTDESRKLFYEGIEEHGMKVISSTRIAVDDNNPIYVMAASLPDRKS